MARKKIIAGNWKMNMTPSEAVELVNTLDEHDSQRGSRAGKYLKAAGGKR